MAWLSEHLGIIGTILSIIAALITIGSTALVWFTSNWFRARMYSLWAWIRRHWPYLIIIALGGVVLVLNTTLYLTTRNWMLIAWGIGHLILGYLLAYLCTRRQRPLHHVCDFRQGRAGWTATHTTWSPTISTDSGLELPAHNGLTRVLTHPEIVFTQGQITCVVNLHRDALFNIVVHGHLHERFYMVRLDTRTEYFDSILSGPHGPLHWQVCDPAPEVPCTHTPYDAWVILRVIVDAQTIKLYRDRILVAQQRYEPLRIPTTISLFAEVYPVYLQKIYIMST